MILQVMLDDFAKGTFLRCGRKFSKTELAIVFGHLMCMYFPNSHGYYIGPTMKHAGELVWHNRRLPDFFTKLRQYAGEDDEDYRLRLIRGRALNKKWVLKVNNAEMRKYFTNGSWFKVDGADNFGNANGMNPHFIIYDEFKLHDPRFHEAMEPNLTTNKAPILIVGTPPEGSKTYYTKIEKDFQMSRGFKAFCLPSYINDIIYPGGRKDPDFLELEQRYKDRGEEDVFKREYLAQYVAGGSRAIFPVFEGPEYDVTGDSIVEYSAHVRPHGEILAKLEVGPSDWEYYAAYDAGTVTCFAAIFAAVNSVTKEVLFLDEIYEKDQSKTTSKQIYDRARVIMAEYSDDWYEVYDNAAAWFANEVHHEYEDASLIPCTKDINVKESRLGMIKDAMIYRYFKLSEKCKWARWEIENYYKDDKGRIPKEDDHLIDAIRYLYNAANYDFVPQVEFKEISRTSYNFMDDIATEDEYANIIGDLYE